jgi:hypothetical protein
MQTRTDKTRDYRKHEGRAGQRLTRKRERFLNQTPRGLWK